MSSDRQQAANRANSRSSTGPKTAAGRARAAKNAIRHGLNVPVPSDDSLGPQVEAVAHRISPGYVNPEILDGARQIAEAQVELNRVRNSRRRLYVGGLTDPEYSARLPLKKTIFRAEGVGGAPFEETLAATLKERDSELAALDRYERRALSRRKSAIRKFDWLTRAESKRSLKR